MFDFNLHNVEFQAAAAWEFFLHLVTHMLGFYLAQGLDWDQEICLFSFGSDQACCNWHGQADGPREHMRQGRPGQLTTGKQ